MLGICLVPLLSMEFGGQERIKCCIINVYVPCMLSDKRELWDRLGIIIGQNSTLCICVIGDFNSIRRVSERAGVSMLANYRDIQAFDSFIYDTGLVDIPLHGRNYTWYKQDGRCKSRIDRVLLNNNWLSRWPNAHQVGLRRTVSDHCPLLLQIKARD